MLGAKCQLPHNEPESVVQAAAIRSTPDAFAAGTQGHYMRLGLLGEGFLSEVTQDSFAEFGEGVEFRGGEQVDEMPADVLHVLGRGVLDGAASGG
jgi:hypothetical protein